MIYLDNQATTRTDPRVVEAMLPYFGEFYGNPHSTQHDVGTVAKQAVDIARQRIASICGAARDEIFFTSGATESNNLAIRGLAATLRRQNRMHVLCSNIEHKCVLASVETLREQGFSIEFVPCNSSGIVTAESVRQRIHPETGLICLMSANNEIGTLQPIAEVAAECRSTGIALHVDAVQSLGKESLDFGALGVTSASLTAHKIYGPKGIGAIYIARKWRTRISPLIVGGGQEGGLRSGTLPVALCVGFGRACEIAAEDLEADIALARSCRARFLETLRGHQLPFQINGHPERRLAGNLNLSIEDVDAEALIMTLKERVALSSGSACTTARIEPSHVLQAIGLPAESIERSIRVSFGRFNTIDDAVAGANLIADAAAKLRRIRH